MASAVRRPSFGVGVK